MAKVYKSMCIDNILLSGLVFKIYWMFSASVNRLLASWELVPLNVCTVLLESRRDKERNTIVEFRFTDDSLSTDTTSCYFKKLVLFLTFQFWEKKGEWNYMSCRQYLIRYTGKYFVKLKLNFRLIVESDCEQSFWFWSKVTFSCLKEEIHSVCLAKFAWEALNYFSDSVAAIIDKSRKECWFPPQFVFSFAFSHLSLV